MKKGGAYVPAQDSEIDEPEKEQKRERKEESAEDSRVERGNLQLQQKEAEAREKEEGRRRAELAKKWEADQIRQQKVEAEEEKAQPKLRQALKLNARGGFDKQACERLQEIIDKYPDTPSAKKAKRLLDKMSGTGGSR